MKLPSKDELKKVYGITDDDFDVLTELPKDPKRGFLIRAAECCGVPAWLWKSSEGRVLAVILLITFVGSSYSFWEPKIVRTYDYMSSVLDRPEDSESDTIAVLPQHTEFRLTTDKPILHQLPTGTGIYPSYKV